MASSSSTSPSTSPTPFPSSPGQERTMSIATTAIGAITQLEPSRISSEAPEVVPEQPQPPRHEDYSHGNGVLVSTYSDMDIKRGGGNGKGGSRQQKQVDYSQTESKTYPQPPTPSLRRYDWEPRPETRMEEERKNGMIATGEREVLRSEPRSGRTFTLFTMVVFIVVAFLLGGGIGGGVGGALLAQEKSKSPTSATQTTTSAPSTATVYLDTAGCPLVHNTTYLSTTTTPSTAFLKLCNIAISSPATQSIELSNSTRTSFDACLDSCAQVRGCVAATWVLFDPVEPTRNLGCYLKSAVGVRVAGGGTGGSECSGVLKSSVA